MLWPLAARASYLPFDTSLNLKIGIGTTQPPNAGLAVMSGNVGIGTWIPSSALVVNGNVGVGVGPVTANGPLQIRAGTDENGFFQSNQNLADGIAFSSVNDLNSANKGLELRGSIVQLSSIGTNPIYFLTNDSLNSQATIRETIDKNGNIGIGTYGSGGVLNQRLTIVGNIGIGTSGPPGDLFTNNAAPNGGMIVEGNVGIGSAAPGQKLDVQGTVRTIGFTMSGQGPVSGYVLTASDSGGDAVWTSSGAAGGWTVSGSNVYETSGGNVGIGTTYVTGGAALTVMNGNVGIGTWAPNSSVSINGSLSLADQNVTSNTTLNSANYTVNVNTAGGPVTITLPTAVGIDGRCYKITDAGGDAGANNITIASNGGTITGSSTQTMIDSYSSYDICSNGTNWLIS